MSSPDPDSFDLKSKHAKKARRRSLVGEHGPLGPSAVAYSRSKGNAVIPFDRAGEAQVDQMLRVAMDWGVDLPLGFEFDAIQIFYSSDGRIDELRVAGFDSAARPWQAAGRAPMLRWTDRGAELLEADSERRHFSAVVLDDGSDSADDALMLALLWDVTGMGEQEASDGGYLNTSSAAVYQAVRDLISRAAFGGDSAIPWPSAPVRTRDTAGEVSMVPPEFEAGRGSTEGFGVLAEQMWQKSRALSDLDADVLDALLHCWMAGAESDDKDVVVAVDEILRLRGLEPKRNSRGYGAGYHPKQRRQVVESLFRLETLWLDLVETSTRKGAPPRAIRSRALVMTEQMGRLGQDGDLDVEQVVFRPGRMFGRLLSGPGRRVAKLPRKALEYDPYRFAVEKRLVRYLSWQWRIRAYEGTYLQPYRVETLLNAIGLEMDARRPSKRRERFEAALDRLQSDRVLAQWQYDGWQEPSTLRRGWWRIWLEAKVVLEPPFEIVESYRRLTSKPRATTQSRATAKARSKARSKGLAGSRTTGARGYEPSTMGAMGSSAGDSLSQQLIQRRKELGWSQLQVAERLGISRSYVSALEAGRRPSIEVQRRLEDWLLPSI